MIVAIEAASTDLSLAITDPDGTNGSVDAWTSSQRQSAELLPRLLALLERHGRSVDAISGIGVGSGPGSFTGLRVAMALGKGLAVGLWRPIVAVPSLVAWLDAAPAAELAIARAGSRDAYVQARGPSAPQIVDRDALAGHVDGRVVVAPAELAADFGLTAPLQPQGAVGVASAAAARLAVDPAGDDPRTVEPIYLRAPRGVATEATGAVKWL
jgi:tRNA threonylcarbamoyladenosine biosynthesis protein TsaB